MNIFEQATRKRLRFAYRGNVTVEDLWVISLEGLDGMYQDLSKAIRESESDSLLGNDNSLGLEKVKLKAEIIKHIVKTRLDEAKNAENELLNKQKKDRIAELIERKKDDELLEKTPEELEAMLEAL